MTNGTRQIRDGCKRGITVAEKRRHQEKEWFGLLSSIRDPYYFASQSSLFRGGGLVGNGFGVGVRSGVGGGDEGEVLSEILQDVQIDQSPLSASPGFGGGGVRSDGGDLVGGLQMRPRRHGGWQRFWQRWSMSSSSYWPRSTVGGECCHMLLQDPLNQGDRIFYHWWRRTL